MGKVPFIITGASGSIGAEAVKGVIMKGHPVIMAVRNVAKAEPIKAMLAQEVPNSDIEIMELNLADFNSVIRFVEKLKSQGVTPCGLFNNAAIINRDYAITSDGYENTLQTNYLSVFLLTRLLMPLMTENANIVNMVSVTRKIAKIDDKFFRKEKKDFSQLGTYSTTKFALLMFTDELV
ncbi:MAG: SDR family NAD(P)-dependent oxidoreductase, partial [Bacteroidales bacterium]|nr:SDR family NAD(P)-dependent oxidoreductase [Bacteroidales bacterium]